MPPGQDLQAVKVYLPVRRYVDNDYAVLTGLANYPEGPGQTRQAASYLEALEVIRSGVFRPLGMVYGS